MSTSLGLVVFGVALFANIALGLLVLLRDRKSWTNRLFFMLISTMNVWSAFNTLSSRQANNLFAARLVLFSAVLFAFFFYLFVATFPSKKLLVSKKKLVVYSLMSVFAMFITLTPLAFKDIVVSPGGGVGQPTVGPGIGVFGLTVLYFDLGGLVLLVQKVRKAGPAERLQRLYLLLGLGLMLLTIIIFNFVLPSFFQNTRFIPYASVFMLPFVVATSYAIIRHHLLDIRAAVARAAAYVLSLGSVGLIYGGVVYSMSSLLSRAIGQNDLRPLFIVFALLTAVIYPRIKRFFDKLTNQVFYQDAYDPQDLLDKLNNTIVSNIDLQPLLRICSEQIGETLKTDFCFFVIPETSTSSNRVIGSAGTQYKVENQGAIIELAQSIKSNLIEAEVVSEEHPQLGALMNRQHVQLFSRLSSTSSPRTVQGYLFIGNKKSGNPFNRQDLQVIEIISNELVIAIQNAMRFEEIQSFNVTLQERINTATRQLRHTNDKLKALDETKDEFISMASHQLRTPLTSVKGYVSMVIEGDAGKLNKVQHDLLGQAFASSQRMVYLIADLLNVSRLHTGKFVIENKPTQLADVVETELGQLQEAAKTKRQKLTYNKPKDFPVLNMDETKIRQVVMNFTDNALYYTPAGGKIDVSLENKGTTIEFTVVDNGIGVPKDEQHKLFGKFFRAGNARNARPDGTGLGLFMAKKVIIAQGGSIIFKTAENKGSTFGFSFPVSVLKIPAKTAEKPAPVGTRSK